MDAGAQEGRPRGGGAARGRGAAANTPVPDTENQHPPPRPSPAFAGERAPPCATAHGREKSPAPMMAFNIFRVADTCTGHTLSATRHR